MYNNDETVYLPEHLELAAKEVQRSHTEEHPWAGIFSQYLDTLLPITWDEKGIGERLRWLTGNDIIQEEGSMVRKRVCVSELWCEALGRPEKDLTRSISRDIQSIMRTLPDWKEADKPMRYGRYEVQRKGFVRKQALNSHVKRSKRFTDAELLA